MAESRSWRQGTGIDHGCAFRQQHLAPTGGCLWVESDRVVKHIRSPDLTFDTYKRTPGSFRTWDNQLRQPILLHSLNSVVARAPLAGFLHPRNYLDTLGADAPESACRLAD